MSNKPIIPNDSFIWLNGEYLPFEEAKTHLLTFSLHYAVGFFEGVRAYETVDGTAIFRLNDHTDRFYRSGHILNMKIPYTKEQLNAVQKEILRKNKLKAGYLRPLCYYGIGKGLHTKSLNTNVMIAAWEWGAYLGAENMEKGIRVKVSSFMRNHVNSMFCKAKSTGNYFNSVMAVQEADSLGYDEALLLDHLGFVAEGSGENFFIVRNGVLYTPDTSSALEGITRASIFQLARDLGLEVREKQITRDEVYIADEAFFTGTAAEVTPIREVDGRVIGSGTRGPITTQLQQLYFDVIRGRNQKYEHWLARV